jgi:hypothetical protein
MYRSGKVSRDFAPWDPMATATWRRRSGRLPVRRWPTVEALLASRIFCARGASGRRAVIGRLIACIGEKVEPAAPALSSPARDRWELRRLEQLHRQLEAIRDRR